MVRSGVVCLYLCRVLGSYLEPGRLEAEDLVLELLRGRERVVAQVDLPRKSERKLSMGKQFRRDCDDKKGKVVRGELGLGCELEVGGGPYCGRG